MRRKSIRTSVSASIRPPGRWIEQSCPDSRSIDSYSWIVYCCSRATFGSPLSVCIPPAACHVEPAFVRWYRTLAPTTPPPMTTTCVSRFTRPLSASSSIVCRDATLGDPALDERIELLADGGIHGWWLVRGEELLPEPVRLRRQLWRSGFLPGLVVPP